MRLVFGFCVVVVSFGIYHIAANRKLADALGFVFCNQRCRYVGAGLIVNDTILCTNFLGCKCPLIIQTSRKTQLGVFPMAFPNPLGLRKPIVSVLLALAQCF